MKSIFVNLKRFDVPRRFGGICPVDAPASWIDSAISECVQLGLGCLEDVRLVFFLPESLLFPAQAALARFPKAQTVGIGVGCQGVHREDVAPGGNFGAFTSSRPASAMRAAGCEWAMVGHSEERKEKLGLLLSYDPLIGQDAQIAQRASAAVSAVIRQEAERAMNAGLKVLVCVGETAEEKGAGSFEEQKPRIAAALRAQLENSLPAASQMLAPDGLVIGYEPVWAIGPGKTPPNGAYIAFVAELIQQYTQARLGFSPQVVYGGGLKEENAGMIAGIDRLGGGLVALTRFQGEIGFYPSELKNIIENYLRNEAHR